MRQKENRNQSSRGKERTKWKLKPQPFHTALPCPCPTRQTPGPCCSGLAYIPSFPPQSGWVQDSYLSTTEKKVIVVTAQTSVRSKPSCLTTMPQSPQQKTEGAFPKQGERKERGVRVRLQRWGQGCLTPTTRAVPACQGTEQ